MVVQTTDFTISDTSFTVGSAVTYTASTATATASTARTHNYTLLFSTDVYEQSTAVTLSVTSNSTFSLSPDITCSDTNQTVALSTSSYNSEPVPSWITIDSNTGTFSGTAPEVTVDTNYSFYLDATWTVNKAGSTQQLFTITVTAPVVTPTPAPVVEEEVTGTQAAMTVAVTTAAVLGVAAGSVGVCCSGGNPVSVWSILHQLQIVSLILLACSTYPEGIVQYLEGNSFAMINLSVIPTVDLPGIDIPVSWMDKQQQIDILTTLDIQSQSTFVNN